MQNPPNRSNSPLRATETTIYHSWSRFTFIFSFNLDIPRYKFPILRLFNILPYISLYFKTTRLAACVAPLWYFPFLLGGENTGKHNYFIKSIASSHYFIKSITSSRCVEEDILSFKKLCIGETGRWLGVLSIYKNHPVGNFSNKN